jgi:hypothetical protein
MAGWVELGQKLLEFSTPFLLVLKFVQTRAEH